MPMFNYPLMTSAGDHSVTLRELNGRDELLGDNRGLFGALHLLNNLLYNRGAGEHVTAEKLSISDRDYLLSRIYSNTYGSRIDATLSCTGCHQPYDINFSLDSLVMSTWEKRQTLPMDEDGFYSIRDGVKFRLPTGEDEISSRNLNSNEAGALMLKRCSPVATSDETGLEIQQSMDNVGPLLIMDMDVHCPECGHSQALHFDMQSYLLSKMESEKKVVASEVVTLASEFGWSHNEILELPRSLRKTYIAFMS